jgi:uncharacterized protein DUF1937
MKLAYLACPYSHLDRAVREERFNIVNKVAAKLISEGIHIFSPISQSHPMVEYGLPTDWEYWLEYDSFILAHCSKLIVLMLPGWQTSIGVAAEIRIAERLGLEIDYIRYIE